ncbi:MAG TPA: hypothetical protein VK181_14170 [Rhizobium sp.]|nr:hypothetical protein [Rhizobium sp.]
MHQQTLCKAIRAHHQVNIHIVGEPNARIFSPHVLFVSTAGHLLVGGIQVLNPAKPRDVQEWRAFDLSKVQALTVRRETFVPDRGFDPRNKLYVNGIRCHVFQNV